MVNFKNCKNIIKVLFVINFSFKLCESLNITKENGAESRIIGGEIADHKGTEHQVSIRLRNAEIYYGSGKGHICGGSIISSKNILTAAHCLYKIDPEKKTLSLRLPKDLIIVMGILDLYDQNGVQRDVISYYYHSNFSLNTMRNDIAILFLSESIPNGHPNIRPININYQKIIEGTENCKVMGWGKINNNHVSGPSRYLMIANVTIVDQKRCRLIYTQSGFRMYKGMMCAGSFNGDVDSCQGDSGGPLTCFNTLCGIVSWGNDCALKLFPGIYTNISYYVDWIKQASPLKANNPKNLSSNFIPNTNLFFIIILFVIFNL